MEGSRRSEGTVDDKFPYRSPLRVPLITP